MKFLRRVLNKIGYLFDILVNYILTIKLSIRKRKKAFSNINYKISTSEGKITAVLNGFKRPELLKTQIEALNNQTNKPESIMLWQNKGVEFESNISNTLIHANCNYNFGVWARFAYALNARTEYVCIFDDDTIPGNAWFENCFNTIREYDGLLGAIGVIYLNGKTYTPFVRHGWAVPNDKTELVDIVGHAWFFRREWLSLFWRELPPIESSIFVGEDIHFSAMLKKHAGINTYVPPHPLSNKEMWGSLPQYANMYGVDESSISLVPGNIDKMNKALEYEIKNGFEPINS